MKIATPPASWIPGNGLRLHAGPYASGVVSLRKALERLGGEPLSSLTQGPYGGIYTPPLHNFKRVYVRDPEHGVPFVGTTTMLHADYIGVPLLSRQQAESEKFKVLRIQEGMTLISCSGTIGRVAYARSDMEGMWSSGDILKVIPNPEKVHPGYLHAFLSSEAGVAAMVAETYGSIVPHIEASHVASLPVPRLGDEKENAIGDLIHRAARARASARELLDQATAALRENVLGPPRPQARELWSVARASGLTARMDAYYFAGHCAAARRSFDAASDGRGVELAEVADVFIPGIFKRRYAADPRYGYPYLTGADVFQIAPSSDRYLMRDVADEKRLVIERGMILIQEAGQIGGLLGNSVMVGAHFADSAVSNNMVRVQAQNHTDTAYLYSLLSSPEGVVLITRESAGSSIPHIDAGRVGRLRLPWPAPEVRSRIGALALRALELREQACVMENDARSAVNRAIEEAT